MLLFLKRIRRTENFRQSFVLSGLRSERDAGDAEIRKIVADKKAPILLVKRHCSFS